MTSDDRAGAQQAPFATNALASPTEVSAGGWFRGARNAITGRPVLTRWLVGGPGAFVASILIIAVMPLWLPKGAAQIDHIVVPIVLFPLIWCLIFLYTCLEENLPRSVVIMVTLIVAHTMFVVSAFA
ncbi:MAG: hypothetical protein AAF317_01620 [Pseudomonadota bacterium]